ncbi:pyruvate, water dikinase regulatory protein [Asticcacaulis sp. EMRT-3]|uniref:pyruvate, water dikinase regulatory protein n=1 Tax=Asticcacaulis sp. EMRT-3 TaxID=3040349 RepID=UPI0024AEE15F|nr:pyruvate, water dikinase regulatory protein [Asticcacaulis sp. EMRT-3]MDI7775826.1 pyruvate, water dikinase regulatory protein [Asticcacaulis sp. EMRT-3]
MVALPPKSSLSKIGTYFHVHLVSDSTGETLNALAKAAAARFEGILPIEHIYVLIRSEKQLERSLQEIESFPGIVLHTMVDVELRTMLETRCRELDIPAIGVLDSLVVAFSRHLGAAVSKRVGAQHNLDNEYFERIEALNYAIAHDDGAMADKVRQADVVLVGVSRTSKTPTCIYLAHRGIKAANIPLVPGHEPPEELDQQDVPLIVGLIASPERLIQIRKNRLLTLNDDKPSSYTDQEAVREEIIRARRLFERKGWPVIDVTRRSIEETSATIISLLNEKRTGRLGGI